METKVEIELKSKRLPWFLESQMRARHQTGFLVYDTPEEAGRYAAADALLLKTFDAVLAGELKIEGLVRVEDVQKVLR